MLSAHMIHVGLWAWTYPHSLCETFGLRLDGQPHNGTLSEPRNTTAGSKPDTKPIENVTNKKQNFWPLLFAPREVGFGLLVGTFGAMGDWRASGIIVATIAGLLATTDGVATGLYGKGGWPGAFTGHGIPAVLLGGMSYVLITS